MTLNNFYFVLSLCVVFCIYWILGGVLKNNKQRSKVLAIYLLLWSYAVVGYSDIRFLICLMLITAIGYMVPIAYQNSFLGMSRGWIYAGVFSGLLFLGIFKYFNFFMEQISKVFGTSSIVFNIFMPLGISFYVFSTISYMLDVYRGKIDVNKSFTEVALYISFFPKFVSGPIVRANAFLEQIPMLGHGMSENFMAGIQIFIYGCFKKMVLADHIGVFVDEVFYAPQAYHSLTVLLAVLSYSLQIYFDFSGYSDMAIGLSKIFGFEFQWNFNFPYLSKNVTEFWKRWHISLSSWLQEYLYYSLGGNRKGRIRTYVNLMITMLLGGLWHGAKWTFIVWGGLHGLALVIHKLFLEWKLRKYGDKNHTNRVWNVISWLLTFGYVSFCWIWFRADSFDKVILILKRMAGCNTGIIQPYTWSIFGIVLLLIMTSIMWRKRKCSTMMPSSIEERYILLDLHTVGGLTLFFVLCGLTFAMAYYGNTVFIYGAF